MTDMRISRYSKGAIILHWTIALLVIANLAIALLTEDFPKPTRQFLMEQHEAFGMIVLVLAFVRIGWRLTHRAPPKPANLAIWEIWASRIVHFLFYALIILLPLSGWVWMSAENYTISMFGLFDVPMLPVAPNKELSHVMHERHEVLGLTMLGLAGLHLAGALKHQFVDRMPFIQRMWPG